MPLDSNSIYYPSLFFIFEQTRQNKSLLKVFMMPLYLAFCLLPLFLFLKVYFAIGPTLLSQVSKLASSGLVDSLEAALGRL